MGIFSRLNDIINSNLSSLLDKAENPEKIIRLVIQEMEDTLVEVRSDAARTIAEKKKLQRRIETAHREAADWESRARLALGKGREDLAKAALVEKHDLVHAAQLMEDDLEELEAHLSKLNTDIGQLQQKLDDAKTRHQAMVVKEGTVGSRLNVKIKLHDSRIEDALNRFETMENRVERMEGKVESYELGRQPSLRDQFAELEAQDIIDEELSRLKQDLNKS